jgi:hypothetical protein
MSRYISVAKPAMSFLSAIIERKRIGQTREEIMKIFELELQLQFPEEPIENYTKTQVHEQVLLPLVETKMVRFKNIGSNEFMTNSFKTKQNQIILKQCKTLEPVVRLLDYRQKAKIKNLGSNEYMINSGCKQRKGGKSISLISSKEPRDKFILSEYGNVNNIFIGDDENVLDFAYGNIIPKVVLYPIKHLGRNQRWIFEQTPNGTIIHSCYTDEFNLVLVQKGEIYTCVPWNDIKDDPEKVKFAYWQITN